MITILLPSTPERVDRRAIALESIKRNVCDQEIKIDLEISSGEGAIAPFMRMLKRNEGLVLLMSDDMTLAPDCIQKLYDQYVQNFPDRDGVVNPSDGVNRLITAPLGDSKTFLKYSYPAYTHLFWDDDMTAQLRRDGKLLQTTDARITHHHFQRDPSVPLDNTYAFTQSHTERDRQTFLRRQANGFTK